MKQYTLFYKSKHPFSNWYASGFEHNGMRFNCSEQYMMYHKAMLFNDSEVAKLIMETEDPFIQKALGRQVRNFDSSIWFEKCNAIMVEGLVEKFTQNKYLETFILNTGDNILVEASPTDRIWGIGLGEDNPDVLDETKWRGENRLGIVLMETRRIIRERQGL